MNAKKKKVGDIEAISIDFRGMFSDTQISTKHSPLVSLENAQEIAHDLCSAAIAICKAIDGEIGYEIGSQRGEFDQLCPYINVHTHEVQERRMHERSREEA